MNFSDVISKTRIITDLQVDLGKRKTITAIATQGNVYVEKDSRLKEYYIQYSDDGSSWKDYTFKGQRKARILQTGMGFVIYFATTTSIILKNLPFVAAQREVIFLQEGEDMCG